MAPTPVAPLSTVLSINVTDTEKRMSESLALKDFYMVFLITTKLNPNTGSGKAPLPPGVLESIAAATDSSANASTSSGTAKNDEERVGAASSSTSLLPSSADNGKDEMIGSARLSAPPLLWKSSSLWRRYTEFETLRNSLRLRYPFVVIPPLPEKQPTFSLRPTAIDSTFHPEFLEKRRQGLETFLRRISSHPVLSWDPIFIGFLQNPDSWKALSEVSLWRSLEEKFKKVNASFRLTKPDPGFAAIKNSALEGHKYMSEMLQSMSRCIAADFQLQKDHARFGSIYSQWACIEEERVVGDALQTTGHYMDNLASGVEGEMEGQETLMERFKEFYFAYNAVVDVAAEEEKCRWNLEKAKERLESKKKEKELAREGRNGMLAKIFGPPAATQAERQEIVENIQREIEIAEREVLVAEDAVKRFAFQANPELDGHTERRTKEFKDLLKQYTILHIRKLKREAAVWQQVKESFQQIS